MTAVANVLLAIANELAETAQTELPTLEEGEQVIAEWFENESYYRKSAVAGKVILNAFDFRKRKCRSTVEGGDSNG